MSLLLKKTTWDQTNIDWQFHANANRSTPPPLTQEKDYFTEFSYPLDVDLQPLVKKHMVGETPSTQPINMFNFTYLKSCQNKCSNNSNPKLLFVVKSAIPQFEQREAIRQTWGNQMQFPDIQIRRVFLLGTGTDPEIQRKVDQEDVQYGDIVQADFRDDYLNNTLKTMSGFKWAVENCPSVRYVLFSDDDMYISIKNLLRFLRDPSNYPRQEPTPIVKDVEHRERSLKQEIAPATESIGNLIDEMEDQKLYAGYVFHSPPLRHRPSKWYVSLNEYPYHLWPPYVTAGAYVVSREALLNLHYGSYYTKYFQFDDIFLALVALKVNIDPVHCPEFYFWKKGYSLTGYRDVIASHGYGDPDELRSVWNEQKAIGHA
uniref:Hexosyltransferase n=1 Tax=Ceriodaphnia reticulata TaxID=302197 RepID=A0A4Y7LZY1_9CRUS|nr:EOG090X07IA [Ceriodaphnia reticulata]SVE72983.1 EOG090X07IA [Ceriodaphnia reticulata]